MKKVGALLLMVGFPSASALGGIVTFEPQKMTLCVQDPGCTAEPQSGTIDVFVAPEKLGQFESADIVIGSDDVSFPNWAFSQDFMDWSFFDSSTRQAFGVYQDEWAVGGFGPPIASIFVGTITVGNKNKAGEVLPDGSYSVLVDSARDGGISSLALGLDSEPLLGLATVNLIPEPAVLTLLGLGAVGLLRRRRAA